jgi:hypothetical protein
MRHLVIAAFCALGCNQSALTISDGGASDLLSSDPTGFCGDPNSPRIEVNGMLAATPATTARAVILDCCEAAELQYMSMQIPEAIVFGWRHYAGAMPGLPVTLDLAKLPSGWDTVVYSRCSPTQPGCTPDDMFTSSLTGWLTVVRQGASYQMSVCAQVSPAIGSTHPVVHTLRLWSPTVILQ